MGSQEMSLYADVDGESLMAMANTHLLNFGAKYYPEVIVRASGVHVYTASGHQLLDWTSGQMSCLLGHGNERIVSVVHQHAKHLDHLFSGMLSPPVINLAAKLSSLLPTGLDKTFFLSTGGESNEAAIKLAKVITGRYEIVGLSASWHGVTSAAAGAQYISGRKHVGPLMPGQLMLPAPNSYRSIFRNSDGSHDWRTELDYGFSLVDTMSAGSLAAVIVEPILSSGGMLTLPPGYLRALRDHCRRRGMLLIVDEAQTAIGRAGDMFAFEYDDIHEPEASNSDPNDPVIPDILTLSKTLGNGLPLSAVITSTEHATQAESKGFMFYTTHLNDPLPAAVGLEVLNIVESSNLISHSRALGEILQSGLRQLYDRFACIGDVRGRGLMAGLEIVADRRTGKKAAPELGLTLAKRIGERGVWAQLVPMEELGGLFRIAPPIVISEAELRRGLGILESVLEETKGTGRIG